jgi:UDP-2,3-diacylglucosamine pyrophosphatase LpxH
MIIVVSDVHLAQSQNDKNVEIDDKWFYEFLKYIEENQLREGGHLVLLGDIVDFWRRDFTRALTETSGVFYKLTNFNSNVSIHYVIGNHDFFMLKLFETLFPRFPFANVTKQLTLQDGDAKFFFIHGYQLEVLANPFYKSMSAYERFSENLCLAGDDTGNAASKLWDAIEASSSILEGLKRVPTNISGALKSMMEGPEKRLQGDHKAKTFIEEIAASSARSVYLGMKKEEVLVYGHTHDATSNYDDANKVINTGSWNKSPCKEYRFIEISDGKINPKSFK